MRDLILSSAKVMMERSSYTDFLGYYAETYVRHGKREWTLTEYVDKVREINRGLSDLEVSILRTVEEADCIAFHWSAGGVHSGELFGALATNRNVVVEGITISRVSEGRIVEEWASWDEISFLRDIGVIPIDR